MFIESHAVMQIGFGTGQTSTAVLNYPVEDFEVIEISKDVLELAGKHFQDQNRNVLENSRLKATILDGKNYVKYVDKTYDVIMNDANYAVATASASLFTKDHFEAARRKLSPGGIFSTWMTTDLDLALVNGRVTRGVFLVKKGTSGYWDDYAEPNLLFENIGAGQFRDVSGRGGRFSSRIENSRGLAFGDVDNDGDVDLLVMNEGGRARLYRNDVPDQGHWLMVRAMDPALRRDAIGAVITVVAGGGRSSRQVTPGYGFLSSHDPRVHFGLGSAAVVDEIEVIWPGGIREVFPAVSADRGITLEKGQGIRAGES